MAAAAPHPHPGPLPPNFRGNRASPAPEDGPFAFFDSEAASYAAHCGEAMRQIKGGRGDESCGSIVLLTGIGQMLGGVITALFSIWKLFAFGRAMGVLWGISAAVNGGLGFLGGRMRSPKLLLSHLVGGLLICMLGFGFVAQVTRDVDVDCALAELQVEMEGLKAVEKRQNLNELFTLVFTRMAEMEEQVNMASDHTMQVIDAKEQQDRLKMTDASYIKHKLKMLKTHAHDILDKHYTSERARAGGGLPPKEGADLEARLDAAEQVLDRIADHEGGDDAITISEYMELLQALTHATAAAGKGEPATGGATHTQLLEATKELPNMKAALERQAAGRYDATSEPKRYLEHASRLREERRAQWQRTFHESLSRENWSKRHLSIRDLPEHCVKEEAARYALGWVGVLMTGLQLVEMFFVGSFLAKVAASKSD